MFHDPRAAAIYGLLTWACIVWAWFHLQPQDVGWPRVQIVVKAMALAFIITIVLVFLIPHWISLPGEYIPPPEVGP